MIEKKKKCYIYTRVSTAIQVDGYSLDAQKDKLRKYADFQDLEIVEEYSDEGHSGKNIKGRPEFMRMLNDIECGKDGVDFVLVFKLSRFGRNAADVLCSLQVMQDYGVNLVCVEDGIDSSKETGKLLISIMAAVSEMERENIRVQTMAGREQKAQQGLWNGGQAPYGYRLEEGKLLIAEDEVEIVEMIYNRYINSNDGVIGVANYLNNRGYIKKLKQNCAIPTFTANFVKNVLSNPIYMGKIAYGRTKTEKKKGTRNETHRVRNNEFQLYDGDHEAIVSEEVWRLAKEKREKNNYRREKIRDKDHAHLLSGILICPDCGKRMYGNMTRPGKKDRKGRYYYFCKSSPAVTGNKCMFRRNIEQSQIDKVLEKILIAMTYQGRFKEAIQEKIGETVDISDLEKQLLILESNSHQAEMVKQHIEQQIDSMTPDIKYYDKKLSDLEKRLDAQYDKIGEIEDARKQVSSQIMDIKRGQLESNAIYEMLMRFSELYSEFTEIEKKQYIQSFIEGVEIYPDRREDGNWIRNIKFNFSVPYSMGDDTYNIRGITFDSEQTDETYTPLKKLITLETVVLLSRKDK